jgi:hypothetical protein
MKKIKAVQVESATFTVTKRVKLPNRPSRKGRDLDADENRFGVCPLCRYTDGYLNLHSDHYFVCHEHELCWYVGSKLFLDYCDESEDVWRKNQEIINSYQEIDSPYTYPSLRDRFKRFRIDLFCPVLDRVLKCFGLARASRVWEPPF